MFIEAVDLRQPQCVLSTIDSLHDRNLPHEERGEQSSADNTQVIRYPHNTSMQAVEYEHPIGKQPADELNARNHQQKPLMQAVTKDDPMQAGTNRQTLCVHSTTEHLHSNSQP